MTHYAVRTFSFLGEVVSSYRKHNGSLAAAALSFVVFVSSFPIILLFIAAFGYVFGSPERAESVLLGYLRVYAPEISDKGTIGLEQIIREIVAGREAATGAGILILMWSGSTLASYVERVVNLAWDSGNERTFLARRIISVILLFTSAILFLASFLATTAIEAIKSGRFALILPSLSNRLPIWTAASGMIALSSTAAGFLMIYKLLPARRVPLAAAAVGAIFATFLWEIAKTCFGLYVTRYTSYGVIYGPLAGLIAFLIWLNCSSIVLILGAEVCAAWARQTIISPEARSE